MIIPCLVLAAVFEGAFGNGLAGWDIRHGNTVATNEKFAGESALVVRRDPAKPKGGTNWEAVGEPFKVTPGRRVSVIVRAKSSFKDLRFCHGYRGGWITGLVWHDKDERKLPLPYGFGFDLKPDEWCYTVVSTDVPKEAATARLSLGMDTPNFGTNDYFAVSCAKVELDDPLPPEQCVTLRDDGFVLVGGKPFFPIGIYAVAKCDFNGNSYDKAFGDLKAAGFNLVHRTRPLPADDNEEFLSAADQFGLKVFQMPVASYSGDFVKSALVNQQKRHPSILAWYLADDTASHIGPEEVAYRDRVVKAFDPAHLTLQADGVMSGGANCRYDRFVHSTDIFLPEIYPAFDAKPTGLEVAEVIRDMRASFTAIREAGNPVKSVWPIIQHFDGWGWKRFPTFEELRAMSWTAIVQGGHGITWYVYNSKSGRGRGVVSSPERWSEMTRVSREIADLQDDLVSRHAAEQPAVSVLSGPARDGYGFPSVCALLKSGDTPLLAVVNSSTNRVRAAVKVEGFRTARTADGARTLSVADGLADEFPPLGVGLYRLAR